MNENMNKIKLLLLGVAAMGVSSLAYSADEVAQTPPCPQQPIDQKCPAMLGQQGPEGALPLPPPPPPEGMRGLGVGMSGEGTFQGMGQNACGPQGMGRPGQMMCAGSPAPFDQHMDKLPKEIKDRIDALHADRDALKDLWVTAVISRGDTPIATVRDAFAKTNEELISKIDKSDKSIKDDIEALRNGFDQGKEGACAPKCDAGEMAPAGMDMPFGNAPFGSDQELVAKIDADVVAAIKALKEPLTVEAFAKIRDEAISRNRQELDKTFGDHRANPHFGMQGGMPMMMPPMDPALARMRDEMGHMRGEGLHAKSEMRAQLREAMKIQDQAKREAAVKKILDDMAEGRDAEKAPSPASK
jgi:hypothetical protein